MTPCPRCLGRLHVQGPDRVWRRCDCLQRVLAQTYIKPPVREADEDCDPEHFAHPPLPLTTHVSTGDYRTWRHRVWRSLLAYEPQGLTYDLLDAYRLTEIQFERDALDRADEFEGGYQHIREVEVLGLLLLIVHPHHPDHRTFPRLLARVIQWRRSMSRPTWIFTHLRGGSLARVHGHLPGLRELFDETALLHWTHAHPTDPPLAPPLHAQRPGNYAGFQSPPAASGTGARRHWWRHRALPRVGGRSDEPCP